MSIQKLSREAERRIASAQVAVTPEAAIKELVENSLDAGADNIQITATGGGLTQILVKDTGRGIPAEDAKFMAMRHYTSKIHDFEDIESVSTYGFRGEALNSICANSQSVVVSTRMAEEIVGRVYALDAAGSITSERPLGIPVGTSVTVNKLFCNMPVRRQNALKAVGSTNKKILDLVSSYALAHPAVRFSLKLATEGKASAGDSSGLSKTSVASVMEAIQQIYGANVAANLQFLRTEVALPAVASEEDLTPPSNVSVAFEMVLPKPSADLKHTTRSVNDRTFIYVNARPVSIHHSSTISSIYQLAKKQIMEIDGLDTGSKKFPFIYINIVAPPNILDVNIEPDKTTVLFHHPESVVASFENALSSIYGGIADTVAAPLPPAAPVTAMPTPSSTSGNAVAATRPLASAGPRRSLLNADDDSDVASNDDDTERGTRPEKRLKSKSVAFALGPGMPMSTPSTIPRSHSNDRAAVESGAIGSGTPGSNASGSLSMDGSLASPERTAKKLTPAEFMSLLTTPETKSQKTKRLNQFVENLSRRSPSSPSARPTKRSEGNYARPRQHSQDRAPSMPLMPLKEAPNSIKVSSKHITKIPENDLDYQSIVSEEAEARVDDLAVWKSKYLLLKDRAKQHNTPSTPGTPRSEVVSAKVLQQLRVVGSLQLPPESQPDPARAALNLDTSHSAVWVVKLDTQLLAVNVRRLQELLVYISLSREFFLPITPLLIPRILTASIIGGPHVYGWLVDHAVAELVSETGNRSQRYKVTDKRILGNGFELYIKRDHVGETTVELTGITKLIPAYDVQDLRLLLTNLHSLHSRSKRQSSQPELPMAIGGFSGSPSASPPTSSPSSTQPTGSALSQGSLESFRSTQANKFFRDCSKRVAEKKVGQLMGGMGDSFHIEVQNAIRRYFGLVPPLRSTEAWVCPHERLAITSVYRYLL
ncbi:uncharacterized protein BJ171DRAFT_145277 [Polychytrium aggregatum]|uniref:uncharacterized protein n=1 Tax=Polychytrium aggregatum TaxID=110093 RepID=UPI0022FE98C6|nr:uncharacterized protein BJ171DRAFT_145277 [Polychytrium aggregatum]KAI9203525.1 hypothetical protein BJ171DRAFT_145277 [Polychytrium aggregatum]